jgi:hypothetical protein
VSIRDVIAAIVATALVLVAASLATTLTAYRRRRERARDSERALGRTIIAELPTADDPVYVTEDDKRFHYGECSIDKDLIVAVRILINGAPIAAYVSQRHAKRTTPIAASAERGERPRLAPSEASRGAASGGGAPRAADEAGPAKPDRGAGAPGIIEDHPEGIARDRWDVAVETVAGTTLIECGAIRERVSQELARTIFDAIKRDVEKRDGSSA